MILSKDTRTYDKRTGANDVKDWLVYRCDAFVDGALKGIYIGDTSKSIDERKKHPRRFERWFLYNYPNVKFEYSVLETLKFVHRSTADSVEEKYTNDIISQRDEKPEYQKVMISGGVMAQRSRCVKGDEEYTLIDKNKTIDKIYYDTIEKRFENRDDYPLWYQKYRGLIYNAQQDLKMISSKNGALIMRACDLLLEGVDQRGVGKNKKEMDKIYRPGAEKTEGWALKYYCEFILAVKNFYGGWVCK